MRQLPQQNTEYFGCKPASRAQNPIGESMISKTIDLTIDQNGVAYITLQRPEKCNALNAGLITALSGVLETCEANETVKLVVLRATGKHFCAGADLNEMQATINAPFETNLKEAKALGDLFFQLYTLKLPTISLVQGNCFGGGIGLLACCDMVLASEVAHFCFSEVKLGLIPAVISPYVIQAIGQRQAKRYCLTAEWITAKEAEKIGLVHQIVPPDCLEKTLNTLLANLLKNGPQAMQQTKRLINEVNGQVIDPSLCDKTARVIAQARVSKQGQIGLRAFLTQSQPDWDQDV